MRLKSKTKRVGLEGVVRGILVGISECGDPNVDFMLNSTGDVVAACSTVPVTAADVGREVVLMFEDGDISRPILLGLTATRTKQTAVRLDGEQLTLSAEREIVLRCGEASITLTRAGKILIRGKYLLSRSSGVNMVKGAVIHLN